MSNYFKGILILFFCGSISAYAEDENEEKYTVEFCNTVRSAPDEYKDFIESCRAFFHGVETGKKIALLATPARNPRDNVLYFPQNTIHPFNPDWQNTILPAIKDKELKSIIASDPDRVKRLSEEVAQKR